MYGGYVSSTDSVYPAGTRKDQCTCQNRGMREHYGNPYLSVSTSAFHRKYQGKGVILVVVVLLIQKLGNRTRWSERFLSVQKPQLASDQNPESAQD